MGQAGAPVRKSLSCPVQHAPWSWGASRGAPGKALACRSCGAVAQQAQCPRASAGHTKSQGILPGGSMRSRVLLRGAPCLAHGNDCTLPVLCKGVHEVLCCWGATQQLDCMRRCHQLCLRSQTSVRKAQHEAQSC